MSEPVSRETPMRSGSDLYEGPIADPQTYEPSQPTHPSLPSQQVAPTRVDTLPQQASTQPGDGSEVHKQTRAAGSNKPSQGTGKPVPVPFKERVIGVAQKTRGTLLGKSQLVEHGDKILTGQTTHEEDRHT
ncbi:hypothetical protein CPB84DRAFT_1788168 [Gymnopilus junonius]|uniref:Uncharacterized protein n=1 Tax=Gymnopilus junonius TaxID=109634 RepID=A0A9P5TIR5_GYMJU|nr:hypothetical protein CPB84DRAFT_1788168 [Gymnopilus junonius]